MTPDRYQEPQGLAWGHFKNPQGADIRYAHVAPAGEVKGRVVLLPGFRESIEKYFEAARDMLARGFEVYLMDWRGQGGSQRYFDGDKAQRAHSNGYDEQIETLHYFTQNIVKPDDSRQTVVMAHSMGSHIALRYLAEHPGFFDAAALTTPMFNINAGMPESAARVVAKLAKQEDYVPGGHDWDVNDHVFEGNDKTNDADRFYDWVNLLEHRPDLQLGNPTYGWVRQTYKSIDKLNDEKYLQSISTPVLMCSAGQDKVVLNKDFDRAAKVMPNVRTVHFDKAQHEVWHETDAVRASWLKSIDAFLAEQLVLKNTGKKPAPNNGALRPAA